MEIANCEMYGLFVIILPLHIGRIVIVGQNTRMRDAVPVDKKWLQVCGAWQLHGECHHSCRLIIRLAKPTVGKCCHEFLETICHLQDDFIKFPSMRAELKARKLKVSLRRAMSCMLLQRPDGIVTFL